MPLIRCHAPAPQLEEMIMGKANAIVSESTQSVAVTENDANEMKVEEKLGDEAQIQPPMKRPVESRKDNTAPVKKVKAEPKATKNISLSFGLSDSDDD